MRRQHHDLNVPLSAAPPSKRRREAHLCRTRLRRLGYDGLAFCHTAYNRLDRDRDDADSALPWEDLLASSEPASPSDGGARDGGEGRSFGPIDPRGAKIYRRLNIVLEEASDVSRVLLPASDAAPSVSPNVSSPRGDSSTPLVAGLLRKYDIVSLQPMSEPALQSVCELLSPSGAVNSAGAATATPNNNTRFVDIVVLEYGTGSRGGLGLPYRLRKEYVAKALRAGATFELCYGAAMLDPKRRQGFLRALLDFQAAYNGIQKKHALLNGNNQNAQYRRGKNTKNDTNFPLLLSSGARRDYSRGTDEGALALRGPEDVRALVCHMVGNYGWFDKEGGIDFAGADDEEGDDRVGEKGNKKRRRGMVVVGPAERVLARVEGRALGVAVTRSKQTMNQCRKRKSRCWDSRAHVVGTFTRNDAKSRGDSDSDDDGDGCSKGAVASLVEWLSEPLREKASAKETACGEDSSEIGGERKEVAISETGKDGSTKADNAAELKVDSAISCVDEEHLEDGFIAL